MTDYGDAALLLPIWALMLAWLAVARSARTAFWWCVALGLCAGGIALMKVYFSNCSAVGSEVHSPSGHSALSMLVYGGLACAIGAGGRARMILTGALAAALIGTIACSRVAIEVHSTAEVLIGLTMGGAALALFARAYSREPARAPPWRSLVIPVGLIVILLHGDRLSAEDLFHAIADYLQVHMGDVCA